jgi:hypothetical protein
MGRVAVGLIAKAGQVPRLNCGGGVTHLADEAQSFNKQDARTMSWLGYPAL